MSTPSPPAQALVLAAGRGQRMRPLTDTTPKPLLRVRGLPLMQWPMQALTRAGTARLLVNTAWLGEQIAEYFGPVLQMPDGPVLQIGYSHEGRDFGRALETAGGILRALPALDEVFWVLAGDVFVPDFEFSARARERFVASGLQAHLWLVPNPAHNAGGDFGLGADGRVLNLGPEDPRPRYTFSTIGLYRKSFFTRADAPAPAGNPEGVVAALAPMLRAAMDRGEVSGELYSGQWTDVGTPERLAQLNAAAHGPAQDAGGMHS